MTSSATLRLLSFLQHVEAVLRQRAPGMVTGDIRRQANYNRGRAWMVCADGGGLLLQAAALAEGQLCLRAVASGPDGEVAAARSVYGAASGSDWRAAAEGLAEAWLAGRGAAREHKE